MTMKSVFFTILGFVTIVIVAGCAPELAKTKYGTAEQQWKSYIGKSYREWEPPSTPPPINGENGFVVQEDRTSIEIVPEPTNVEGSLPQLEKLDNAENQHGIDANLDLPTTYTVQKGDTLWAIAYKFYKNGKAWRAVQDANKDLLPTPDNLKAGMVLSIPAFTK